MYEVIMSKAAKEYYDTMPERHQEKADAIMTRLAAMGPMMHRPHADHVRGKIKELRCGVGTFEHRFLFFFDAKKIILTHGFLKKEDKLREGEIARAERFHAAYFSGGGG
jgi:hypothetical protein